MAVIRPSNEIRRLTVLAPDLEDFAIADRLLEMVRVDDDPVTDLCMHVASTARLQLAPR